MAQQIILNVEDSSIVSSLRKVLSLMEGVTIVRMPKVGAKKAQRKLTAYEQSMDDLKNGKVTTYSSAEEFYKEMGI